MANNFNITSLLQSVDQLGQNYVSTAYQALANAATSGGTTGVAGLLLTLYVIFWGVGIWQGTASGGPTDYAFRLFRAMMIYVLATRWGEFQTFVYTILNDGPSAIGNALLSAVTSANNTGTSANLTSVNAVQSALQNMWDTTNSATEAFLQNAGITNWGPYIFAAVFYVVMAILIGFAIFLIVLSKMFMWLLLALAPLFIILLLFGVTSRFFSGWMSSLAQYFLVQVLVYAFLAFYVSLIQQSIDTLNGVANSKSATWATIGPVVLLAIIGILLLSQINNIAAAIAGGVPIFAPRLGAVLATASGYRMGAAANRARLAFRNPFNPASMARREELAARQRARVGLRAASWTQSAEFRRLADQLRNSGVPPAQSGGGRP
ncbi:conjugal transfer protein TrbL [Bradyrhizobium sp. INPA01-394B]|uniref:Type IV secretion system protein n=1 Tax=Bradyrhizobium campsiandrae TaxID=1729892 RepID=A0ABR7U2H8_9BRAD|nr:type IV secretion system protein [Bradyrhizobium campsiandrae]MBC9877586.1 conjugal transfer protein TrbL [Bradyrhizobium campsiandrae]MBC9978175.1 type IV secretion system protein [Bradyrhizobium campsiandrae]